MTVNQWKEAVLDELANCCMDATQDEPPRSILKRVIQWNVQVALDPAVSDAAQALIDQGAAGVALPASTPSEWVDANVSGNPVLMKAMKNFAENAADKDGVIVDAPCPTCGEAEPFTGTCGTSPKDAKALCNRSRGVALGVAPGWLDEAMRLADDFASAALNYGKRDGIGWDAKTADARLALRSHLAGVNASDKEQR